MTDGTKKVKMTKATAALGRELADRISATLGLEGRAAANGAVDDFREAMRINRGKRVNVAIDGEVHVDFSRICKALARNKQVVVTMLVAGWCIENAPLAQRRLAKDAEALRVPRSKRPSCGSSNTPSHQDSSAKT